MFNIREKLDNRKIDAQMEMAIEKINIRDYVDSKGKLKICLMIEGIPSEELPEEVAEGILASLKAKREEYVAKHR